MNDLNDANAHPRCHAPTIDALIATSHCHMHSLIIRAERTDTPIGIQQYRVLFDSCMIRYCFASLGKFEKKCRWFCSHDGYLVPGIHSWHQRHQAPRTRGIKYDMLSVQYAYWGGVLSGASYSLLVGGRSAEGPNHSLLLVYSDARRHVKQEAKHMRCQRGVRESRVYLTKT